MAETKETAKPSGSKPTAGSTTATSTNAKSADAPTMDVYFELAESIRQGRSSLQQRSGEAYRTYLDTLRVAGKEVEARIFDSYRQLHEATQGSQRVMAEAQQALIRGAYGAPSETPGSSQVASYLNTLEEAQRRQEEAYRTFCDDLRASWEADFLQRSQKAYRTYIDALQSITDDANRAAQDATRAYLKAIKDYWSQLDVDAASSAIHQLER